jgi:hypothetical protein
MLAEAKMMQVMDRITPTRPGTMKLGLRRLGLYQGRMRRSMGLPGRVAWLSAGHRPEGPARIRLYPQGIALKDLPAYDWIIQEGRDAGVLAPDPNKAPNVMVFKAHAVNEARDVLVVVSRRGDKGDTATAVIHVLPDMGLPDAILATFMPKQYDHDWLNAAPRMEVLSRAADLWPAAPAGGAAAHVQRETVLSMAFLACPKLPPALADYDRRLLIAGVDGLYALAPWMPKSAAGRLFQIPGTRGYHPKLVAVRPPTASQDNPFLAAFVGRDPNRPSSDRIYVLRMQDGQVAPLAGGHRDVRNNEPTTPGSGGDQASFASLSGLAMDRAGNVYALDKYPIWRVTPKGLVTRYAGSAERFQDGLGDLAGFRDAACMTLDPANDYLYVEDTWTIRQASPHGEVGNVKTILGIPWRTGGPIDQGAASHWPLDRPGSGRAASLQCFGDYLLIATLSWKPAVLAFNLRTRTLENLVDAANNGPGEPTAGPMRHFTPGAAHAGAADLGGRATLLAADSLGSCFAVVQTGDSDFDRTLVRLDLDSLGAAAAAAAAPAAAAAAAPRK